MHRVTSSTTSPFSLALKPKSKVLDTPARITSHLLDRALKLDQLNELYSEVHHASRGTDFIERILQQMNINVMHNEQELRHIPRNGPLIITANHPFGILDGIMLVALIRRIRPDFKIMSNHLMACVPESREFSIFVDPFGSKQSISRNMQGMKECLRWLKNDGALGIFPGGTVSHIQGPRPVVRDPVWHENVAKLVRLTGATVLPVHIEGSNSLAFHVAGLVHPRLRTAMLPHELLNKRDKRVRVRIGSVIPARRLEHFTRDAEMMRYLRCRTYALAHSTRKRRITLRPSRLNQKPVAPGEAPNAMAREIAALPVEQRAGGAQACEVFWARLGQIPCIMAEIGRLRELTFRAAGEGTGQARDLDAYDQHYYHLFIWNKEAGEIVGAYRMGLGDEIIRRNGLDGFYTSSLFHYAPALASHFSCAVEFGRSFIRAEYQRSPLALNLLWKGIGQFLAGRPRYRWLFGPVSISNDYHQQSRLVMARGLQKDHESLPFNRLITPRKPLKSTPPVPGSDWPELLKLDHDSISDIVHDIERGRGIPVLLRQYLKLGGQILGFNVDPAFGWTLDALIFVDLLENDSNLLGRYLGESSLARIKAWHATAKA